jgi:hypothetical protein
LYEWIGEEIGGLGDLLICSTLDTTQPESNSTTTSWARMRHVTRRGVADLISGCSLNDNMMFRNLFQSEYGQCDFVYIDSIKLEGTHAACEQNGERGRTNKDVVSAGAFVFR